MGALIKSIYAGFMIGIGGIVYLSLDNKILGALFFSFGLLTIVIQGFYLYTGKVGFINKFKDLLYMILIAGGNFVGTYIASALFNLMQIETNVLSICNKKLSTPYEIVFIAAVLCGAMMYLAIANYLKTKNILFLIAPVMIFILCGFEHSIANMFYFSLANAWNLESIKLIAIMILGNGVGANMFRLNK